MKVFWKMMTFHKISAYFIRKPYILYVIGWACHSVLSLKARNELSAREWIWIVVVNHAMSTVPMVMTWDVSKQRHFICIQSSLALKGALNVNGCSHVRDCIHFKEYLVWTLTKICAFHTSTASIHDLIISPKPQVIFSRIFNEIEVTSSFFVKSFFKLRE